jgi:hypothetical protein
MKFIVLAVLSLAVVCGCGPRDPIERVVQKESVNDYFGSGLHSFISLPATASVQQVVGRIMKADTKVLTNRDVRLSGETYTAALVENDGHRKVVLIRYEDGKLHGWWHQEYDE